MIEPLGVAVLGGDEDAAALPDGAYRRGEPDLESFGERLREPLRSTHDATNPTPTVGKDVMAVVLVEIAAADHPSNAGYGPARSRREPSATDPLAEHLVSCRRRLFKRRADLPVQSVEPIAFDQGTAEDQPSALEHRLEQRLAGLCPRAVERDRRGHLNPAFSAELRQHPIAGQDQLWPEVGVLPGLEVPVMVCALPPTRSRAS